MSHVSLRLLEAGYCRVPEFLSIRGGSLRPVRFPASVAVIEHPREGIILFDTGYSPHFHAQTRHFPNRFYAWATPVTIAPEDTAERQLAALGIQTGDVRTVILSHFHADHVAGVSDFSNARYLYLRAAYSTLMNLGDWGSIRAGFLRGLLPGDFEPRSRPLEPEDLRHDSGLGPFPKGFDIFNDGSILAIPLPGHAPGHLGLLIQTAEGRTLLAGDACWSRQAFLEQRLPPLLIHRASHDPAGYVDTLSRLHALANAYPDLRILPSHCRESYAKATGVA